MLYQLWPKRYPENHELNCSAALVQETVDGNLELNSSSSALVPKIFEHFELNSPANMLHKLQGHITLVLGLVNLINAWKKMKFFSTNFPISTCTLHSRYEYLRR